MENEIKEDITFSINIDFKKANSQKKIIIEGIEIYFPYDPYPAQEIYMKKIILTLKNNGNISALESPTGTGKTLCLLCAILGWIKYKKEDNIKIYYCTKTVSQIKNVMKELNKTCYTLKTSFLTSRKFSCIKIPKEKRNEYDISKLNDLCELYRKKKYCKYYKTPKNFNYSEYDYLKNIEKIENIKDIEDIEDLFEAGKKI